MRRSDINAAIRAAEAMLADLGVSLPPFASWEPDALRRALPAPGILAPRLGWDVTDFGSGDFPAMGLTLVTLRNGTPTPHPDLPTRSYAEKVLIVRSGQVTPMHTHRRKTEDIAHKGGAGRLVVTLRRADGNGPSAGERITVWTDGLERHLAPGERLELGPGESVTLVPGLYHSFWAEGGDVLAGEVSSTNDDATDNVFLDRGVRFTSVEEDEPPYRLLVSDYDALERSGRGRQESKR